MIKIFKMKKYIVTIVVLMVVFTLSSCSCSGLKNDYKVMPNGVDITVKEEYLNHMLLKETVPVIHFDYHDVRISTNLSDNSIVYFVQNDQVSLSDAFANHLSQYEADQLIETRVVERIEKNGAVLGKDKYPLDEGTKSLEKIVIATTKDGSRVSYSFRTFTSNGKTYYAYTYIENMSIGLEMPFMTVVENNEKKLVLLPLPYDTKYIVGGRNIDVEKLLTKEEYLNTTDKNYYIFNYSPYLQSITQEKEKWICLVKAWYEKYCNGHIEDGIFIVEYLGIKFSINFDYEKFNNTTERQEPAFKIDYIGVI